jgi:hypothetical protein
MTTYIGPITDSLIDHAIKEINSKKQKEKIMNNIIDPLLCDLAARYYPYFIMIIIILCVIILLLIALLFENITHRPLYI